MSIIDLSGEVTECEEKSVELGSSKPGRVVQTQAMVCCKCLSWEWHSEGRAFCEMTLCWNRGSRAGWEGAADTHLYTTGVG